MKRRERAARKLAQQASEDEQREDVRAHRVFSWLEGYTVVGEEFT